MPIPKDKQKLYAKVIGHMINIGKSPSTAKNIAEAAVKPGHQRTAGGNRKKSASRKKK